MFRVDTLLIKKYRSASQTDLQKLCRVVLIGK